MKARSKMTREVVWITPEDSQEKAYRFMQIDRIRHLPVLEGRNLVGMLSDRDIFKHGEIRSGIFHPSFDEVSEAMSTELITCSPSTSIAAVASIMIAEKIDALPVVNLGNLVGLITSSDLLEILSGGIEVAVEKPVPYDYVLKQFSLS